MCETGVTQEQIDETRLMMENAMLSDMQNILNDGGNFEFHGQSGETPVMQELHTCSTDTVFQKDGELLIVFVIEIQIVCFFFLAFFALHKVGLEQKRKTSSYSS